MLNSSFRNGLAALSLLSIFAIQPITVTAQTADETESTTTTSTEASSLATDGSFIAINSDRNPGSPIRYINADNLPGYRAYAGTGHNWYSAWLLVKATKDDETVDSYYLYNEPEDLYIGKTSTTAASDSVALVKDIALAGRYHIYQPESGADWWGFEDVDNSTVFNHLQIEPNKYTLINYRIKRPDGSWAANSQCQISDVTPYFSTWFDELYSYKVGKRVGDVPAEKVDALLKAKFTTGFNKASWQAYKALEDILQDPANIIEPIKGHYYRIHSAFPYFADNYLAETYYAVDYHGAQRRQRIHFNKLSVRDNIVPTLWQFDPLDETTDNGEVRFRLKAANSGLVMRQIAGNTVIDTREATNSEAGIFTISNNEDLIVYPHALTIYCPNTKWYMSTFTTNAETEQEVTDVRGGNSRKEATEGYIQEANNWFMTEVRELPIYFETQDGSYDENTDYIKTICLPFAVQIPDDVKAYTASFTIGTDKAVQMQLISTGKIIPANSPVVLKRKGGETALTILYPDEYPDIENIEPLVSGLIGALSPIPLGSYEAAYVIDPDGSTTVKRVIEGYDYSYDEKQITNVDAGKYPDYSLMNCNNEQGNPVTYILPANEAFVDVAKITELPEDSNIDDLIPEENEIETGDTDNTTAAISDVSIDKNPAETMPARDANGNIIYYDLTGRATINPSTGLYILSNGHKVLFR
jgi:hypothetical protein